MLHNFLTHVSESTLQGSELTFFSRKRVTMAALLTGTIQAMGFTQAGISAGSWAASMMSAAAPVGAGGFIAACQSIGATGTLSFATAAIANGLFGVAAGALLTQLIVNSFEKRNP
ncbi:hypothetical protein BSL78_16928 [Apostichopus japonicus]|uniref:Uncharacterized protein n=1 Tax=Stichopus japonicus TaxID=307972 RepID=A0A2G8KDW3_STIJA|nr:hypothetical protein BSL78_16928 [Apostichopus japonicus]